MGYLNESSLAWLSALIRERYGLAFSLRIDDNPKKVVMSLPGDEKKICIRSDDETFASRTSRFGCGNWSAEKEGFIGILKDVIPAPGAGNLDNSVIKKTGIGYEIDYDILGMSFWVLNRIEELETNRTLNRYENYQIADSHAMKNDYLQRPIVDEWLDILRQIIVRTWPQTTLKSNVSKTVVSHDVDSPSRYGFRSWKNMPRGIAGDLFARQDWRGILGPWIRLSTKSRLSRFDAYNTFDWLMDTSDERGLTSAFYFIPVNRDVEFNCDYELGHPAIRALIRHIHERGHEIGLHPSYHSYKDPEQICHEADSLRTICDEEGVIQTSWGGRMHFLQWEHPTTLRAWDAANMSYDSTLGYADVPGFRCGTAFEYPAYDPVEHEMLNTRIRPLIAMDCSVTSDEFMGLGVSEEALDVFLDLKKKCERVNGNFTLLWHNSSLRTYAEKNLYLSILDS